MQAGVTFTDDDVRRVAHVCILGQGPAQALFGNLSPVGKEIRVNNVSLKVIGLLRRKGASMTGRISTISCSFRGRPSSIACPGCAAD